MPFTWDQRRLIRVTIEYWVLLLLLAAGLVYYEGSAYRDSCRAVPGIVIGQVGQTAYNSGDSPFKPRPVFGYTLNGEKLQAVAPYVDMPVGTPVLLLVDPRQPHEICVYNAGYWVVFGFDTFPIFLFGGLIYATLRVMAFRLVRQLQRLEALAAQSVAA
jgi:hypothetical protein